MRIPTLTGLVVLSVISEGAPALATVYTGTQTAGVNGSGTITVTTDGTTGTLGAANIVAFKVSSTINGVSYDSASVPGNTGFCVDGANVTEFDCAGDPPSLGFFATLAPNVYAEAFERRSGIQVIAAVPEPAGWMLAVGIMSLALLGRRRTRA